MKEIQIITVDSTKAQLLAFAEKNGIPLDGRMNKDTMLQTILDHSELVDEEDVDERFLESVQAHLEAEEKDNEPKDVKSEEGYVVQSALKHDGKQYKPGDIFEGEAPARLLEIGVLK